MVAISIIIPSYNRAHLLRNTLGSVLSQTSREWECIVVDDFSNDDTKAVVMEFSNVNPNVTYYLNEHKKGAQGARNTGLDHAKYDWVVFFDSDNKMHSDFVETMIGYITNNGGIDVFACCSDVIDIDNGYTGKTMKPRCSGYIHDDLFYGKSYVDYNQGVIKKEKLTEIHGLDEDCPSMQEWDTHIRLSNVAKYLMIEKSLIDYYVGGSDAISSNKKREVIGRLYILRKHLKEWKARPLAITTFAYQIFRIINKNEDRAFIKEKINELKSLVPYLYLRIGYCKCQHLIERIKRKI